MPVPPAGFAQCNVFFNLPGQSTDDAQVTFGIQAASYSTTVANNVFGEFVDRMEEVLPTTYAMNRLELRDSGNVVFTSTTGPSSGTRAATATSPQVAYLMVKRTALGGRRNRGRMYVPGVAENGVDEAGIVSAGLLNDLNLFGTNFLSDLGAMDIGMFILHADGGTPTEVTELVATNKVATQRRRLDR